MYLIVDKVNLIGAVFFPSEGGKLKLLLNSSHFEIRILNISNRQQDMW